MVKNIKYNQLVKVLILFAAFPFNYYFFWKSFLLSTVAAFLVIAVQFLFFHAKKDFIKFFVGLIFGAFGEISAVKAGVWYYSAPHIWGIPLWIALYWGVGIVLTGRLAESLNFKNCSNYNFKKELLFFLLTYFLIISAVYTFPLNNLVLFFIFISLFIINIPFKNYEALFYPLFLAPAGTILEIIFTFQNVWGYTKPCFFKITYWLFFLYALFSLIVGRVTSKDFS